MAVDIGYVYKGDLEKLEKTYWDSTHIKFYKFGFFLRWETKVFNLQKGEWIGRATLCVRCPIQVMNMVVRLPGGQMGHAYNIGGNSDYVEIQLHEGEEPTIHPQTRKDISPLLNGDGKLDITNASQDTYGFDYYGTKYFAENLDDRIIPNYQADGTTKQAYANIPEIRVDFGYGYSDYYDLGKQNIKFGGIDYTKPVEKSFSISNITQTTAKVSGVVESPYHPCNIRIYAGGNIYETTTNASGSFSYTMRNLSPYSTYNVEVKYTSPSLASSYTYSMFETLPVYIESISMDDIHIDEGVKIDLQPAYTPYDASITTFLYEPDSTSSFTIDKLGRLTAKEKGSTQITITSKDGTNIKTTANVTVYRPAKSMTANYERRKITVNTSFKIEPKILPAGTTDTEIVYTSSNSLVASVEQNGTVTGVEASENPVTITVTLNRLNGKEPLTDTVEVYVSEGAVWDEVEIPINMTTDWIDSYFTNLLYIRDRFSDLGIDCDDFDVPQTQYGKETPYYMVPMIMQDVERSISYVMDACNNSNIQKLQDIFQKYVAKLSHGGLLLNKWVGKMKSIYIIIGNWVSFANDVYEYLNTLTNDEGVV